MCGMMLDFEKGGGLLPAVIQDVRTRQVLMLGYMNEEALRRTREEGQVTFYSRSRKRLWTKGETSGNRLLVDEIVADCDQDSLLITVRRTGPACHTGAESCFAAARGEVLAEIEQVIDARKAAREPRSYTATLVSEGLPRVAQKVGEEAVETVIAALAGDRKELIEEGADLLFHLLVLLRVRDVKFDQVLDELRRRRRPK